MSKCLVHGHIYSCFYWRIPGQVLCVCGNSRTKDTHVEVHRFPNAKMNPERKALWLSVFGLVRTLSRLIVTFVRDIFQVVMLSYHLFLHLANALHPRLRKVCKLSVQNNTRNKTATRVLQDANSQPSSASSMTETSSRSVTQPGFVFSTIILRR